MTAIVSCDRCGGKYTLVADTHVVNNFKELVTVPWYTFAREAYDNEYRYKTATIGLWTLYKGKDYCPPCWQGYLAYKAKLESKEDFDYIMEEKRKEQEQQMAEAENKRWKEMQADKYLEHLDEVAPPV